MAPRRSPRAEPTRAARRASTRRWAPCRFCAASALVVGEVAAVLAAVEHVLHEGGDARRVGTAGALELALAGRHCLRADRSRGGWLDLGGHSDFVIHDATAP